MHRTFWRVSSRFECISKMGSNNQQLNLSRNMMRRARLNRRGKRVCNCSRMMTWIQERKVYIDTFLSWRNPKKQNKLRATWLTPQLALHQFARPIVTFRLSAFLLFLGVHLTHHNICIGWARTHLSNWARLATEPFREEKLRPLVYQVRFSRLLQSRCEKGQLNEVDKN